LIVFNFRDFETSILQVKKPAAKDTPTMATIAKECQINQKSILITYNYYLVNIMAGLLVSCLR